jgi:hypothetical protein
VEVSKEITQRTISFRSLDPHNDKRVTIKCQRIDQIATDIRRVISTATALWPSAKPMAPEKAVALDASAVEHMIDSHEIDRMLFYTGTPDVNELFPMNQVRGDYDRPIFPPSPPEGDDVESDVTGHNWLSSTMAAMSRLDDDDRAAQGTEQHPGMQPTFRSVPPRQRRRRGDTRDHGQHVSTAASRPPSNVIPEGTRYDDDQCGCCFTKFTRARGTGGS